MSPDFHIIIPARYASSRLPGKLLLEIHGKTVIERVYQQALKANPTSLTIATDHDLIADVAKNLGARVVMTAKTHPTGSDRLAEAIDVLRLPADAIVVNVQGDEPFIPPALIQQVAVTLASSDASVATLCAPIKDATAAMNPNVVKVVRNQHQQALYFSRSLIPFCRDNPQHVSEVYQHIGLYAYRVGFLKKMVTWPVCPLESLEALEQLRILWHGHVIQVDEACVSPQQDINTEEDLLRARELVADFE